MEYTDEQQKVIHSKEPNASVIAVAGSGKTTCLLGYAEARPTKSKLLLAYNSSVSKELTNKIITKNVKNTTACTTHSLAFQRVGKYYSNELKMKLKSDVIVEALSLPTNKVHQKSNLVTASQIKKLFDHYCLTAHDNMGDFLENYEEINKNMKDEFYYDLRKKRKSYIKYLDRIWEKMDKGGFPVTHDFYLKKYQLSKPTLTYDIILLDESQDTSPVVMDIFMSQKRANKVLVGDKFQSIYGWRLAKDAMEMVDYPKYYLTNSFRFPQSIANTAMKVLELYSLIDKKFFLEFEIKGLGKEDPKDHKEKVKLCRTNAVVLDTLIDASETNPIDYKLHLAGNKDCMNAKAFLVTDEGYNYWDIFNIQCKKPESVINDELKRFKDIKELEEFADMTGNINLTQMIGLVKKRKGKMSDYIKMIEMRLVPDPKLANLIITTGHKSKGLEWDQVELGADFFDIDKILDALKVRKYHECGWDLPTYIDTYGIEGVVSEDTLETMKKKHVYTDEQILQEINLTYVAVTRAKKRLDQNLMLMR